jgi:hypothetical protein
MQTHASKTSEKLICTTNINLIWEIKIPLPQNAMKLRTNWICEIIAIKLKIKVLSSKYMF